MSHLVMLIYKLKEGCSRGLCPFWLCGRKESVRYYLTPTGGAGGVDSQSFSFFDKKIEGTSFRFYKHKRGGERSLEVNQKELAKILGISDRWIRLLRDNYGLFASGMTGGKTQKRYVLEKCIPEYINYKIETEVKEGTTVSKEREQAEHERIKKKISILKLRKLKKELHEAKDVEEFLTGMLVDFKDKLLSVPQKVAPLIIAEDDVSIILDILEKEIFETMERLSEYDPSKIDKDTISSIIEEDEEEEEE